MKSIYLQRFLHSTTSYLCSLVNLIQTLISELSVFPTKPQIKHSSASYPLVPPVNFIQNPQASDEPYYLVNLIQELPQ
jgi:hypothetical protein